MAENSQLRLSQVPEAFATIGAKHNALVDLLRTMTGTGMANVVFSEGKIIINVPTVSVTGGGTIPDPLTLNTFNGTNFNGGTFNGAFVGNVTGDVSGNAGTVTNGVYTTDTGTVTNTMLAGSIANNKLTNSKVTIGSTDISLGASASSLAGLSSVSSTNFTGNLNGNASTVTNGVYTTDTGTVTNTMLAGSIENNKLANSTIQLGSTVISLGSSVSSIGGLSSVTATQFFGNLNANSITAYSGSYDYLDASTFYVDYVDAIAISCTSGKFVSLTANSLTFTDIHGGTFYSNTNGVVTLDGRSITFYVDNYTYGAMSPAQYLSASSNSIAYYGQAGITISNNFTAKTLTLLASGLNKDMSIKEIDVCSGGVAKKMLILASDPY